MKLEALTTIYTPETTAALEDYRKHLRETHARLEETQNIAIQTLEEYEKVGAQLGKDGQLVSGPMADIARRYGALAKEVEAVRADMSRLRM
jgi:diphthamide biosynthesis protein 3